MNDFLNAFKQYGVFTGRSRRRVFWNFTLFSILFSVAFGVIDALFFKTSSKRYFTGPFSAVFSVITIIPSLAVGARRLHDVGKSGWWQLISLVPFIGLIWLIILLTGESASGSNKWGPNPKTSAPSTAFS